MQFLRTIVVLMTLCLTGLLSAAEEIATPVVTVGPLGTDHREFATVLAAVVKHDGVDYAALTHDHAALDRYRAQLATATVPTDRAAKLAFFINAYNAETLALVIAKLPANTARWPTWSIKDAGSTFTSVWKGSSFVVGGSRYTLDQLEHAVLRPLGEPRIHLAINCASRSCPPIAAEPYRAATLDEQLETAARAFVASTYHVRLDDGILRINPILDWFGDDFNASGGVRAFLAKRASAGPVATYLATDKPIRFFDYDWKLNLVSAKP